MYKYIFSIFIILFLLISCDDIPRDNILDPKNSSGYCQPVILIEAFVNTSYPACDRAIEALNLIEADYGGKIVIAEYHRDVAGSIDSCSYLQFDAFHQKYVDASSSSTQRGIPDIFVNGAGNRVSGASSVNSVRDRLNPIISELVIQKNEYILEPNIQVNGTTINASCKVARLGNQAAAHLRLKLIFIKDYGKTYLKHVSVLPEPALIPCVIIDKIEVGEFVEKKFDSLSFTNLPDAVIFTLTSDDEVEIFQTIIWEI